MDRISLMDCARQDEQTYWDKCGEEAPIVKLGEALHMLMEENPIGLYFDHEQLQEKLREIGVSNADIWKLCLMTEVRGLEQLFYHFHEDGRIEQRDLDRYVQNAVRETGLSYMSVMELTGMIVTSVGAAFDYSARYRTAQPAVWKQAFIIPPIIYEQELSDFRQRFEQAAASGCLPSLDCTGLDALVATGLPKAKFYKGCYLLHSAGPGGDAATADALALLQEAAQAGDGDAAAELGDFYFRQGRAHWTRAFDHYTGFGAPALNEQRRRNMARILRQRQSNRWILFLSAALLLAALVALILLPGKAAGFPHCLLGAAAAVCSLMILVWAAWRNHRSPYGNLLYVPACILGVWAVCMTILLH